jgi:hypothetical protein
MPLLASHSWSVAGAYRIEMHTLDGQKVPVVVADWNVPERNTDEADWSGQTLSRDYWPVRDPEMAEHFARVSGGESLLDFNRQHGLLGYDFLHRAAEILGSNETWQGDPVAWALAHARIAAGILGAVAIINDVRGGKELNDRSVPSLLRGLFSEFAKMGLEAVFEGKGRSRRFAGFVWTPPEALITSKKFQLSKKFSWRWGNDPIGTSYVVLSWVLNQYIRRVRFEFVSGGYAERFFGLPDTGPRFGPEFHWDALLQVIYWQLAESVGGAFRQCPRCGRVFPTSSGRDKYCSTRCSDAMRSKRYRDNKKNPKKKPKKKKRQKRRNR